MNEITNQDLANRLDGLEGLLANHANTIPQSVSGFFKSFQDQINALDIKVELSDKKSEERFDQLNTKVQPFSDFMQQYTVGAQLISIFWRIVVTIGSLSLAAITAWTAYKSIYH